MSTPTLAELATQVEQLYTSCNSMSEVTQNIMGELASYNVTMPQLLVQIQAIGAQQETMVGNINQLNKTLTLVVNQMNLSSLVVAASG